MTEDVETLHLLLPGLGRPFTWRNERHISVEKVRDARCGDRCQSSRVGPTGGSEVELLEEFKRSIGFVHRFIPGRLSKRRGRKNVDEEESDEQERCSAALPLHALSTWGNLIKDWLRRRPQPAWRGFKSLGPWQWNMTAAHAAKAKSDKMSPEDINESADVLGKQIWRIVPYAKNTPSGCLRAFLPTLQPVSST